MAWNVYGLIDPRNNVVFYVGLSSRVDARKGQHCADSSSPAWRRCREILDDGQKVRLCVFGSFADKQRAKILEGRLILALPDVVNKKSYHGLPSSTFFPDWQDLRSSL